MEADGIPRGYDQWRKLGVVRDPLERLWSLFRYLQTFDGPYPPEYIAKQRASVQGDFSEWILNNETPFTHPYDSSGNGKFYPKYMIGHNLPENRKSQFVYLRPDLGTKVFQFDDLESVEDALNVEILHLNASQVQEELPVISEAAMNYVVRAFAWDIEHTGPLWYHRWLSEKQEQRKAS